MASPKPKRKRGKLPPPEPFPAPPRQPPAPSGDGNNHKINILIVDDTPENLIALEAVLADLGQNIFRAASGEEALRFLLRHEFAAILLDVNMPGLNGFETASLIRQRKSSEHTPIIFVSAISTSEMHMYKGYSLGAVDYIFTPIVPEVLRSKVAVFAELSKKTEETRRQSERLREIEDQEHRRQLNEAAERLEFETNRNRFFNLSIDMLAIAGFDGHFKQLNPSWQRVLGFSESEFKSKPLIEFLHPEDRLLTTRLLDELQAADAPVRFENRCRCKDGRFRWLSWTAAPFVSEKLIYLFARDITARKESEQEIKKLNRDLERRADQLAAANQELENEIVVRKAAEEALKETNAELESFSYSVSHDLRAPLRAMQAFADALLEDYAPQLDEMGQDFAHRIVSAASRMEGLIQDLLVYSRVSHTDLKLQPLSMDTVLQDALRQLEGAIRESGASISIEPPLLQIVGHHQNLVQVVSNLLSNAIKFVAPGIQPQVRLSMEKIGARGRLCITDNGIGIPPEFHSNIFRVFERLHGIEAYPGTGIGLAIVRKGILRMGGDVGLESIPSQGSRFWLELPLAET